MNRVARHRLRRPVAVRSSTAAAHPAAPDTRATRRRPPSRRRRQPRRPLPVGPLGAARLQSLRVQLGVRSRPLTAWPGRGRASRRPTPRGRRDSGDAGTRRTADGRRPVRWPRRERTARCSGCGVMTVRWRFLNCSTQMIQRVPTNCSPDLPPFVVQDPAVAHQRAAGGGGDQLGERRDAILKRHAGARASVCLSVLCACDEPFHSRRGAGRRDRRSAARGVCVAGTHSFSAPPPWSPSAAPTPQAQMLPVGDLLSARQRYAGHAASSGSDGFSRVYRAARRVGSGIGST